MRSIPHQGGGMMEHHHNSNGSRPDLDARSGISTKSSRSSVLERARAYNQKIDEQRAKSMERASQDAPMGRGDVSRSHSAGRAGSSMNGNRVSTRERAMQSVRNEPTASSYPARNEPTASYHHHQQGGRALAATPNMASQQQMQQQQMQQQQQQQHHSRSQQQQQYARNHPTPNANRGQTLKRPDPTTPKSAQTARGRSGAAPKSKSPTSKTASPPKEPQQEAVVTPELLVDALSGHEDGLLAIAERLMEHYDAGYDVMGEAIIDAFADVQKLFQHVVEAAHMEGAAFEAQRREAEMTHLRKQVGGGEGAFGGGMADEAAATGPGGGPSRHDEFIDQDVKDVLGEAIRKGTSLRDSNQHLECYKLYETACQSASALLPVDSDHRGRLQLSIARAESMSPDRACAILRYAMDDVLRSGLRAGKASLPDVSKRGDCVLSRPKEHPSLTGSSQAPGVVQSSEEALASLVEEMKEVMSAPVYDNTPLQDCANRFWKALGEAQKAQSKTEERLEQALGKLKGEYLMARAEWEEKLTASQEQVDLYKTRYMEAKNGYSSNSSFSTPNGKRSHHHHSHMSATNQAMGGGDAYLEQARAAMKLREARQESSSDGNGQHHQSTNFDSIPRMRGSNSVASLGTSLSQHARSIAGTFNCAGAGTATGEVPTQPMVARPGVKKTKSNSSVGGTPTSAASGRGVRQQQQQQRRGRSRTIREGTSSSVHNTPS